MNITYDDSGAFRTTVGQIPAGWPVALLTRRAKPSGNAATIVATTPEGVAYRDLDADGNPVGPIKVTTWEELDRVHVY